jgi:putative ABC transport system permease protein
MLRLFLRHSLRYFARHRTLSALNVLGVALGVTVFVSVQIVNHSALQSFRASIDIVAGKSQLEISGDGLRFDEKIYPLIRQHPAITAATPLVEEVALLTDFPGEYLQILGLDVFTNLPFRTFELRDAQKQNQDAISFLSDPQCIALSRPLATRLKLKIGDPLHLQAGGARKTFRLGFLVDFNDDTPGADEHIAIMDIANVQENFLHVGRLNRIDCQIRPGADLDMVMADLRHLVPADVLVQPPARRSQQVEKMIGAFQLNLAALSLISLLVGLFLIYNTVANAVVRRRMEIGLLRSLGLTGNQVTGLFLGEALLLGLLGLALGLPLGVLLASQLVGMVSQNITSLYILVSIQHLFVAPAAVVAAIGLALGAVLLAAWFPAREAATIPPVEALSLGHLESKSASHLHRWLWLSLSLFAIAGLLAVLSLRVGPAWLSFAVALLTLLGFAFLSPPINAWVSRLGPHRPLSALFAFRHFGRSLHRNSVTVAALVTALAMLTGVSIMIYSFKSTVEVWLNRSVTADVFVAPAASLVVGHRITLPPEIEPTVAPLPGLAAYDTYREIKFQFRDRPAKLVAIRFEVAAQHNPLTFVQGDGRTILPRARAQGEVVVSEAFSRKFSVGVGDSLPLKTPQGSRNFRVAGVFYDYTTDAGIILIDAQTFQQEWKDSGLNSLALYLQPGANSDQAKAWLRSRLAPYGEYLTFSNRDLRQQVFRIFDQTFAVTYILQTIGVLISGLGICLSLLILIAERRREIGVLRAVGATRAQVMQIILTEAGLTGLVGASLGLIAGLALAVVLTYVINLAFFGWTIHWAWPWGFLAGLPVAVTVVAVIAGYFPARQAARFNIAEAVKLE